MYLYVISENDQGPCKIGFAAKPLDRLQNMQIGNPRVLSLSYHRKIGDYPPATVERIAHSLLWIHRMRGEWFNVTVETACKALDEAISRQIDIQVRPPIVQDAYLPIPDEPPVVQAAMAKAVTIRPVKPPSETFLKRHPEWMKH